MTVEKEKIPAASGENETTAEDYSNVVIKELQLGVWKLKIAFEHGFNPSKSWQNLREVLPLFLHLALEIFRISPGLFAIFIFCQFCEGIEESFLLQLSNNLLRTIETGLVNGKPNTNEIMRAITSRLMWTGIVSMFHWYGERVLEQLENRVTRHYELALMQANLSIDLPTSQAPGNKQEASARQAWECLQEIISFHTTILKTASHLFLIMHVSRSTGGPLFALLCISQPMFSVLFSTGLWNQICFGFINNVHYQRMRALQKLVGQQFRQDIISGGLAKWISEEFRKSHEKLGSLSERHPFHQYSNNQAFSNLGSRLLGDLPMIFCAANAIMNPTKFSVSSIAILQQTSDSLRNSVFMTIHHATRFRRSMSSIKTIYNSISVINSLRNGNTPYPQIPEKPSSTVDPTKGMGFCLKNVTFNYAGSQNKTPALNDLSLTIKPGQIVIIVGANGSGKSTLIRILSRLYDPTSGEVLIDDLPSSHYKIDDLHEATSLLSQDSLLYPLSLAENIGLGYPEHVSNTDMILEAAQQGGALEFTKKLNNGMETILEPSTETFQLNLYGLHDHPLHKEMQKIKKKIDISGGEKQRVVASRSFMRFKSGKVKFVAVDEPSSALDAEGELQLFKNLLAVREGKTMVFVTHRFGHLTKHANLILCMKDGSIVESGTHPELMAMKGEYANLYDIQASAFSDPAPPPEQPESFDFKLSN